MRGRPAGRHAGGSTPGDAPPLADAIASVDGEIVPQERWDSVVLREGQTVQVRAVVRGDDSNPVQIVLLIAVMVAAFYVGPAAANFLGFAEGTKAFTLVSSIASAGTGGGGRTVGEPALSAAHRRGSATRGTRRRSTRCRAGATASGRSSR